MSASTYWISHQGYRLDVVSAQPTAVVVDDCVFYKVDLDHLMFQIRDPSDYRAVGLPEEPKPGSCWKVKWVEASLPIQTFGGECTTYTQMRWPVATDVTDELREKP